MNENIVTAYFRNCLVRHEMIEKIEAINEAEEKIKQMDIVDVEDYIKIL